MQTITAILPAAAGPPATAGSVSVAALAAAPTRPKLCANCRADQHAEEGHRAVRRALTGQNKLAQRTAASQHSRKADNVHTKNIPEVLGMRDRLTGKTEVKAAVRDIIDRHHSKQSRDNADKIEIFHQDDVADAACKAHTALLRERTDNERHDQRKDNRRVLAAGPSVLTA